MGGLGVQFPQEAASVLVQSKWTLRIDLRLPGGTAAKAPTRQRGRKHEVIRQVVKGGGAVAGSGGATGGTAGSASSGAGNRWSVRAGDGPHGKQFTPSLLVYPCGQQRPPEVGLGNWASQQIPNAALTVPCGQQPIDVATGCWASQQLAPAVVTVFAGQQPSIMGWWGMKNRVPGGQQVKLLGGSAGNWVSVGLQLAT